MPCQKLVSRGKLMVQKANVKRQANDASAPIKSVRVSKIKFSKTRRNKPEAPQMDDVVAEESHYKTERQRTSSNSSLVGEKQLKR